MKLLPRILLVTAVLVLIIGALLLSGLRYLLPNINDYRSDILSRVEQVSGIPIDIRQLEGEWRSFGPALTLSDVSFQTPTTDAKVVKITVELDIWRSLLSLRWRFRDLTFYDLDIDHKIPFELGAGENAGNAFDSIDDLFLLQFDHFTLKDSQITFLTPSEEKITLILPELTWFNQPGRHRAQGFVSLETLNKQPGYLQVKLDLVDNNQRLSDGTIYLQADNIDVQPWLNRWIRKNSGLRDANFSLSTWISLKNNRIDSGLLQLRQGEANWEIDNLTHNLQVNDLVVRLRPQDNGWLFNIPELDTLKTDEYIWQPGSLSVLYLPTSPNYNNQDHWRIRAKNIELARLGEILPTFSFLTPDTVQDWQFRQPTGLINNFSLDITPAQAELSQLAINWQNIEWKKWKSLPAVSGFSGELAGGKEQGRVSFKLADSIVDYTPMFKAPFDISSAKGEISWRDDNKGFELWSSGLDIQAKALWANGDFRYQKEAQQKADLNILAGLRLSDAGEAWRYFPQTLMGQSVADYLTQAIIAGSVDNATLIFKGEPTDFPFKHNNGQFQVFVPLRDATFEFDPDWPALFNLNIDLDFLRQGLFMRTDSVKLGKVTATNLTADIPDYGDSILLINADINGSGKQIANYFTSTPMKGSIGETLDILQIDGDVVGDLSLEIPLEPGKQVIAKGTVKLDKNDIYVQSIESLLKGVTGEFTFDNGKLLSNKMAASWFGQPISLSFQTNDEGKDYQVDIDLAGNWLVEKINFIPEAIRKQLAGTAAWKGAVGILIPAKSAQETQLDIQLNADISKIKSQLPGLDAQQLKKLASINARAQGTTENLQISGDIGQQIGFNTQWLLDKTQVALLKGRTAPWEGQIPQLPSTDSLQVDLPAIHDPVWFGLAQKLGSLDLASSDSTMAFSYPKELKLTTPQVVLGGQEWGNLSLALKTTAQGPELQLQSADLTAKLTMPKGKRWQLVVEHLYYNPASTVADPTEKAVLADKQKYDFSHWPILDIHCQDCWVSGLKLGEIKAVLTPKANLLQLTAGSLTNSATKLTLDAVWQSDKQNKTQIAGLLSGNKFDETAAYYGVLVPIIDSPYEFKFDINWMNTPWSPDLASLNGKLAVEMGKGAIAEMGGGKAGQLLRLVSFDALLRKLRFDFSDTFGNDFNFDSIKGTAQLKNGILKTKDTRVDGLIADIALSGEINIIKRDINIEVVVTPEISATVGVATAFAVNPIIGAAVFAASKVLGPLWSKISVIRYQISGSVDEPKIDEVLRQFKETQ